MILCRGTVKRPDRKHAAFSSGKYNLSVCIEILLLRSSNEEWW